MKILLDTCVWGGVRHVLESVGHGVIWTGEWDQDPGDEEILSFAYREGRILVTLDKDFGELAVVHGLPHAGIVRLVNLSTRQQGEICLQVLSRYENSLEKGALITAEWDRVRIRE
ncbi:MAG: DUF5615 family PIN-like protein [Chloroflexota bacterium]